MRIIIEPKKTERGVTMSKDDIKEELKELIDRIDSLRILQSIRTILKSILE